MNSVKRVKNVGVYQLKVTVRGSKPPIWRRMQVGSDTTLPKLHRILQAAMGWSDYHLHLFNIEGDDYSRPDPEYGDDMLNERSVRLGAFVQGPGFKFIYEYDFGDSWRHDVLVEKMLPPEAGARYPVCLTGKRACPPEDCGGIWGYANFLDAIGDPQHEEHDELLDWIGGSFDPEAFDLDAVNRRLRGIEST
jgi:hypothetical protein